MCHLYVSVNPGPQPFQPLLQAQVLNMRVPERRLYTLKNAYSLYWHMPLLLLVSFIWVVVRSFLDLPHVHTDSWTACRK